MTPDPRLLTRARQQINERANAQYQAAIDRVMPKENREAIRQMLETPAGRDLLTLLRRLYVDGELVGGSDAETYLNLGKRAVAQELRRLGGELKDERTGDHG